MNAQQYQRIFAWFNARPRSKIALYIAGKGAVVTVYAAYSTLLGFLAWRRAPLFWGVFCVPAAAFLLGTALRAAIDRPRPYETLDFAPLFPKATKGKSMPSRHSFCAAAIAVTVGIYSLPLGAALGVLALLIAVTRVLTGVHYISDVLAGLAFGTLAGAAGFAVYFALIG